jgi:hypothetical protein
MRECDDEYGKKRAKLASIKAESIKAERRAGGMSKVICILQCHLRLHNIIKVHRI